MTYHHLTPPEANPNRLCVTVQGKLYPVCWLESLIYGKQLAQEFDAEEAGKSISVYDIPVIIRTGHYHGFRITACHTDPQRYAAILAASTPATNSTTP